MKTKYLVLVVMLLVIVNLSAISIFFLGKNPRQGSPSAAAHYLIKELRFTDDQQRSYIKLVKDHRSRSDSHREKIKAAKKHFFDLLKQPLVVDSTKQVALKNISKENEELDLLTFNHFQEVRTLCTKDQKKKFDSIINKVLGMIASPRPPGGRSGMPSPPSPQ